MIFVLGGLIFFGMFMFVAAMAMVIHHWGDVPVLSGVFAQIVIYLLGSSMAFTAAIGLVLNDIQHILPH
jgi:hypothetical protein